MFGQLKKIIGRGIWRIGHVSKRIRVFQVFDTDTTSNMKCPSFLAFGYCTFVWGNLVTWRSKKHSVVTRSNAKVGYRAMSLRICEKIWLQKVLSNLHQECETPMKLFCDNKVAISIANNLVQHGRIKHVEMIAISSKKDLTVGAYAFRTSLRANRLMFSPRSFSDETLTFALAS